MSDLIDAPQVVEALKRGPVSPIGRAYIPLAQGFYAWWCRPAHLEEARPPIPAVLENDNWSLLYVGIAPVRPGPRTLVDRIERDHRKGNIGGSTFRQSLGALLRDHLGLKPKTGSDRSRFLSEVALTKWMDDNVGITTARRDQPWEVEAEVIAKLGGPLNLDSGTHPFKAEVRDARRRLRADCGL
jgi:hypothetical protein